jgi:hypothetical protein
MGNCSSSTPIEPEDDIVTPTDPLVYGVPITEKKDKNKKNNT